MIRFAILKQIGAADARVVLEYSSEQILARTQARVREQLSDKETALKHKFTKAEVQDALAAAWADLVSEFKDKTLVLK